MYRAVGLQQVSNTCILCSSVIFLCKFILKGNDELRYEQAQTSGGTPTYAQHVRVVRIWTCFGQTEAFGDIFILSFALPSNMD